MRDLLMLRRVVTAVVMMGLLAPVSAWQSQGGDIDAAIRQEANAHSQIMRTLHFLTDVYGPRVTGSPNLKAAGQWAVDTLESWGLTHGRLDPWEFGHPGSVNEQISAHVVSPVRDALTSEVLAWTPGTNGTITAHAFHLVPPDRPTPGELTAFLDRPKDNVKGKIVLASARVAVPVNLSPPAERADDERVRAQVGPNGDAGRGQGGRGAPTGPPPPMTNAEISRRIDDFLVANGALLRINDARRELG